MTESLIASALSSRFSSSNIKYKLKNSYIFRYDWETDFFVMQNSGYCYEIEIKISRSDFFIDFKKKNKHEVLSKGGALRPNKFYYCVPENLISPNEVPSYAGLMYMIRGHSMSEIRTIKEPSFLHKDRLNLDSILCPKFYAYWRKTCVDLYASVQNEKELRIKLENTK